MFLHPYVDTEISTQQELLIIVSDTIRTNDGQMLLARRQYCSSLHPCKLKCSRRCLEMVVEGAKLDTTPD